MKEMGIKYSNILNLCGTKAYTTFEKANGLARVEKIFKAEKIEQKARAKLFWEKGKWNYIPDERQKNSIL